MYLVFLRLNFDVIVPGPWGAGMGAVGAAAGPARLEYVILRRRPDAAGNAPRAVGRAVVTVGGLFLLTGIGEAGMFSAG
jgi:hypothetical protein